MVNRKLYFDALAGTLKSALRGNPSPWLLINHTGMMGILYWLTPGGAHAGFNPNSHRFEEGYPGLALPSYGPMGPAVTVEDGSYFIAMSLSGGLAGVFLKDARSVQSDRAFFTCADFLDPGDIGPIPEPDADRPIPPDSPRVVVGCGVVAKTRNVVMREQFWRLAPDSYSLGPGETRTVSNTQTSGMESTTSEQQTMAASLNVSTSAGWGPVSASVSASLSDSTTTFQQVTLSSQQTTFISRTLEPSPKARTVLYWQLTEVITIFAYISWVPLASSITGLQPILSHGPYDPGQLPPPRRRSRMTAEERERAPIIDQYEERPQARLPQG